MLTERWRINQEYPEAGLIAAAAEKLSGGAVVAFPTETVYGLGALALNPEAVEKIFIAKDRPPANPLIVHIADLSQAYPLIKSWNPMAEKLALAFWPGPLTIILPATELVPAVVRGGGEGVGVRMPAHPVAKALIQASGPLAAPSANRSGRPSPRTADEVFEDLEGRIPLLLDAGATPGGLESTVLNLNAEIPTILRPGGVSRAQIEDCLGREVNMAPELGPAAALSHYQTTAQILVATTDELGEALNRLSGKKIAMIANNITGINPLTSELTIYTLATAGEFYTRLRQAEKEHIDVLVLVRDAGLPWDEAMEHRIASAIRSFRK